jgi:hypothetical protein
MAIDTTRNLPSFSEMYNAFKNRGNIGEAINAGTQGYFTAKNDMSKRDLQASEAHKNEAEAEYNRTHAKMLQQNTGVIRLDQITDPKEKADLAQYATPNAEGILIVPLSTYNAVTHKQQNAEALDLKKQLNDTVAKHNQDIATKDQQLAAIAQEKAALQAQLGPKAQAISANRDLATSAGSVEPPTLLQRGVSFIKEAAGGSPLTSVLAERQAEAARAKLAQLGGADTGTPSPTPSPTPAPTANPVDEATGINIPKNSKIPTIDTTDDFNKLPPGSQYYDSYGNLATKPGKRK